MILSGSNSPKQFNMVPTRNSTRWDCVSDQAETSGVFMNGEVDMKSSRTSSDDASNDAAPDTGKLPYQKPAFRHEGVFETMALACGKISSTQRQCTSALKQS